MSKNEMTIAETIDYFNVIKKPEKEIIKEIERLIKLGADVNFQLDGCSTAAQNAARVGSINTLKLLIENGADLTLKNRWKEDIKSAAKLSESKEMVAFVKEQLKLTNETAVVNYIYYKPKKNTEAEYTFTPNKKYKDECGSAEKDVGYFLNDSEVLMLEPTKPATLAKNGTLSIQISEGKISIDSDAWDELTLKKYEVLMKNNKTTTHDIDSIRREYLNP
jgi:hypothetical protein